MNSLLNHKAFSLILILSITFISWLDPYNDEVKEGNRNFHEKKFKEADNHYTEASKYAPNDREKNKLEFNHGNVNYMNNEYDSSIDKYRKSLQSEDINVQKKAFFNMGNAYLKKGNIDEAINSYINSLKVDPNYEAAKKNLEYILKKKDKQDQNKNDNKDSKNDKKDNVNGKEDEKNTKDNKKGEDKPADKKETISKEQIKNIMESMKNKPVKRNKGKGDGQRFLDKNW